MKDLLQKYVDLHGVGPVSLAAGIILRHWF